MSISFEAIKLGDKKSFREFFLLNNKEMMRYASYFISDFDAIEDIVQDCFIMLWEGRDIIDIRKSPIGYLKQSIKNKCLNYYRHKKVKLEYGKTIIETQNIISDGVDEELIENIRKSIYALPVTVRRVLELNVIHGLKYAEIAEDMGISINTVKYHVKVAYKSLRKSIKTKKEFVYFILLLKKIKI